MAHWIKIAFFSFSLVFFALWQSSRTALPLTGVLAHAHKALAHTKPIAKPFSSLAMIQVRVSDKKNAISLDKHEGIGLVKLVYANPLNGLDFTKNESLYIRVIQDGNERLDAQLKPFVKRKRKKIAEFGEYAEYGSEDFIFENFSKLEIEIYDTSKELEYEIDIGLFVRPVRR